MRLMIIREGGRGKSGRLCAHCQARDCTLYIGSIVEAQPVQTCSLKGHTIADTKNVIRSGDPGPIFTYTLSLADCSKTCLVFDVCCEQIEVDCFPHR